MRVPVRSAALPWVGVAVALVIGAGLLIPIVAVSWLAPKAREMAVERLEERFDDVRLDSLELQPYSGWSILPTMSVVGEGLSIRLPRRDDAPPFIQISKFTVDVSLSGLFRDPVRIRNLRMDGLVIQIPTGDDDSDGDSDSDDSDDDSDRKDEAPPAFVIEDLVADGTILRILPDNPDSEPLVYDLQELYVASAGLGEPMEYDAVLQNAKPPGRIVSTGRFGPLRLSDVGASEVSGDYTFERADLGDFGGIGGTLYSEGRFEGILSRLEVKGFTQTPDFLLSSAAHPISLETNYEAIVDGTNGDTFLTPVLGVLGESPIHTKGGVFNQPGTDGKTVCLDASGDHGRIQDFLYLAMGSEPPLMTGDIRFASLIMIPPGDEDVIDKLVLDGEFLIDAAHFSDASVQKKIEGLSETGRGLDDAEGAVEDLRKERVLSSMHGAFELEGAVMRLTSVSFVVPGASVSLSGTYDLAAKEIDFKGELRLDAKLSETTSGIKSFLLKIVDPIFSRDGSGAVIPIKISGTPDEPSFGADLGRVITRKQVTEPMPDSERMRFRKTIPTCRDRLGPVVEVNE